MNIRLAQTLRTGMGVFDTEKLLQRVQRREPDGRVFRAAMAQAYTTCSRHYYPKWTSFFLDMDFQVLAEGRLRDCYLRGVTCMGPGELARFWADQIRWTNDEIKQRLIAELAPVAERFLDLLAIELCERRIPEPC